MSHCCKNNCKKSRCCKPCNNYGYNNYSGAYSYPNNFYGYNPYNFGGYNAYNFYGYNPYNPYNYYGFNGFYNNDLLLPLLLF